MNRQLEVLEARVVHLRFLRERSRNFYRTVNLDRRIAEVEGQIWNLQAAADRQNRDTDQ